jgi:prevent-host-death family protein
MADSWLAAAARHHFSEVIDAAVEGRPQFVRRRDGHEVVVVSKEYFEKTRPNLKSYLQSSRYEALPDADIETALRMAQSHGVDVFAAREAAPSGPPRVRSRHRRPQ